jgi:hypothetical protein
MRGARSKVCLVLLLSCSVCSMGCRSRWSSSEQSVVFFKVPVADRGGPDGFEPIQGRVLRADPGDRIVLYAHSGCRSRKSRTTYRPTVRQETSGKTTRWDLPALFRFLIPSSHLASGNNNYVLRKWPTRRRPRLYCEQLSAPESRFPAPPLTLLAARIDDVRHQPVGSRQ